MKVRYKIMKVEYKIKRSKNNQVIEQGIVKVDIGDELKGVSIEDTSFVNKLLEIILYTLTDFIKTHQLTKQYGYGYIADNGLELIKLIFTDEDNLPCAFGKIQNYLAEKMPNIEVEFENSKEVK